MNGPERWLVICEAREDKDVAVTLADRILATSGPEWVRDQPDTFRKWVGVDDSAGHLTWKHIPRESRRLNVARRHGYGLHGPTGYEATELAKGALIADKLNVAGVLAIRDTDNDPSRERYRAQVSALRENTSIPRVCLGLPHPELEAWLLHGFEPSDSSEQQRLQALKQELGFDPCIESHRLNPGKEDVKTSTKRVFSVLLEGDSSRRLECYVGTALDTLRKRGFATGLTQFMDDIEAHFAKSFF